MNRLLLLLALAQLWLLTIGQAALSTTWRARLGLQGRSTRRLWSVFRHGWQFLQWMQRQAEIPHSFPCHIQLHPPH